MTDGVRHLAEPYPVADTYVDLLGGIETTGQNLRLVFATARTRDNEIDYEIVQRIVLPIEAMIPAMALLFAMPTLGLQLMAAFTEMIARQRTGMLQ